jgi:hypothetical protein
MTSMLIAIALLALVSQTHGPTAPSPYAAQIDEPLKALSAEEQSALLDGQGMGLAKAAELNGYPGPKHVLELAEQLALSDDQRRDSRALFERMRTAARREGAALIEAERALDRLYASRAATRERVDEQLHRIEAVRARLRGVHLDAHLEQAALLDPHQLHRYAMLRGHATHQH